MRMQLCCDIVCLLKVVLCLSQGVIVAFIEALKLEDLS
jgi:hypothetical protein